MTLTRDSLGMGAFFLAFDTVKRTLAERRYDSGSGELSGTKPPELNDLLVAGSTAGLCFWLGEVKVSFSYVVCFASSGQRSLKTFPSGKR